MKFSFLTRYNLEKSFLRDNATLDADVIGLVHDAHNHWTRERIDFKSLKILEKYQHLPSFLVLNKVGSILFQIFVIVVICFQFSDRFIKV